MKSRIALIAVLATGIIMSSTGATLAVTGIAREDDASAAQYGGVAGTQNSSSSGGGGDQSPSGSNANTDTGDTAGDNGSGDDGQTLGDNDTSDGTDPAADSSDPSGSTAGVSATRQVAAGSSKLPFTGLAVFPLLIGGVALLLTGAFMRRSARTDAV